MMSRQTVIALLVLGALILTYAIIREVQNRLPVGITDQSLTIVDTGTAEESIPAINNPQFVSVAFSDVYLSDGGYGLHVVVDGQHRFYPYQILVWHQVVNDEVLVTYDPLCGSGAVYERGDDHFSVSGKVWENNMLMIDEATQTLWSQARGQAVQGSRTNETLVRVPSQTMLWSDWKASYPDGLVLSRSTGAIRDYTSSPYGDYANNLDVYFPLSVLDSSKPIKEIVTGDSGETMYWFCWATLRGEATR